MAVMFMATQTGSIYISESMIDVIEISTANVGFSSSINFFPPINGNNEIIEIYSKHNSKTTAECCQRMAACDNIER